MALSDCIADIRAAAGRALSDDEILRILDALDRRARAKRAASQLDGVEAALRQAADELGAEERLAALIEKRNRHINIQRKLSRFSRYAASGGQEAEALRAMNVGAEGAAPGLARSVDAERIAIEGELTGPLVGELRQAGLLKVLRRRREAFDRDVARELWRLSDPAAEASGNRLAATTARILGKYQELARLLQNDAGAYIRKLPGWIVRQSHDAWRIAHAASGALRRGGTEADFLAWRDFILPRLDDRTFLEVGPESAARDQFLRQVWVNLVSGVHAKAHGAGDWLGGFTGPGNLAKRVSEERVLHFRSADDWFDYNQRFGRGSLLDAIMEGLGAAARNTALMRTWGTNPEAAFKADLQQLQVRARDRGDFDTVKSLAGWRTRSQFDVLTGAVDIPGAPNFAVIAAAARALIVMAKLGGVVLSSFPDIPLRASALRHHGINYLEGVRNGFESLLKGRRKGEERELADYMAVGIDGALGAMLARFSAVDSIPGRLSKHVDRFFRLNFLAWWTDSMKTGAGLMLSHNLARNAGKAFDELGPDLRRALGRYGIEAAAWDRIRASEVREIAGKAYLTGEDLADDELRRTLRMYFVDSVNEAMNIGGAREKAITTGGLQAGTPLGEASRFFWQFKAYPLTFVTRQLNRELRRKGAADVVGIVALILGTTTFGYLSTSAKSVARGLLPPDPLSAEGFGAAMAQGGGLGIYGDFLLGQYNRFGGGGIETIGGPAIGIAGELARVFGGARDAITNERQQLVDVGPRAARFVVNQLPYINLFYTRQALDWLILYQMQEAMNPGFLERFERRVEREQGRSFIFRPSEAIPRGGGDRLFEGIR